MTEDRDPPDLPDDAGGEPSAEDRERAEQRARDIVKRAMAARRAAAAAEPPAATSPEVEDPAVDDQAEPVSQGPASSAVVVDDVDLKDALRGALRPPAGAVAPNLLKGVQRKLRVRSRGKFYGDGWSTAESPKTTYLITAIIMLILIGVLFFALVPWSSASL